MHFLPLLPLLSAWTTLVSAAAITPKIHLQELPILVTFFPLQHFRGPPFVINGIYDQCYNFRSNSGVRSLVLGVNAGVFRGKRTRGCKLYATAECRGPGPRVGGDWDDMAVAWEKGGLPFGGDLRSFKCWV